MVLNDRLTIKFVRKLKIQNHILKNKTDTFHHLTSEVHTFSLLPYQKINFEEKKSF